MAIPGEPVQAVPISFYNDGSIPGTTAATADVIITGESSSQFGWSLTSGDFNADGKTDLAVGARVYSTNTGRAYIFYNDGSIPTTAATADVIITGETTSNFGVSLTSGDLNADGKLISPSGAFRLILPVLAAPISSTMTAASRPLPPPPMSSSPVKRRVVISALPLLPATSMLMAKPTWLSEHMGILLLPAAPISSTMTAASRLLPPLPMLSLLDETTSNYFGYSLASGDFNADGKTDLAVGAQGYSTNTGRAYIFITEAKVEESIQQLKSKGTFKAKGSYQVKYDEQKYWRIFLCGHLNHWRILTEWLKIKRDFFFSDSLFERILMKHFLGFALPICLWYNFRENSAGSEIRVNRFKNISVCYPKSRRFLKGGVGIIFLGHQLRLFRVRHDQCRYRICQLVKRHRPLRRVPKELVFLML
jgi:hypothetical protein